MKKKLTDRQIEVRNDKICNLYEDGYSFREIAKKVNLSKSRCHEIVQEW